MHITINERRVLEGIREHGQGGDGDTMSALASIVIEHAHLGSETTTNTIMSLAEKGLIIVVAGCLSDFPKEVTRYGRMTLSLTQLGWQECRDKMIGEREEAEVRLASWNADK